jgi:hypothetical protein
VKSAFSVDPPYAAETLTFVVAVTELEEIAKSALV